MGLKPDHWIRKMALEQRMIEPFVDGQVRDGVISYGLSSYGYDIRVADEFKIFQPEITAAKLSDVQCAYVAGVLGAQGQIGYTASEPHVVDPKSFDAASFVDFKGEVCFIPPNSFTLSRTVEYFRIPRNVLTVCLGKSSYARCFRGDTRVALVDGTAPTLEEMARRADNGEMFWGYSIGPDGRMIVALLDSPRYIGQDALIEVALDTDESTFCTGDHLFMKRDGRWVEAGSLRRGDSLMPLYREVVCDYEAKVARQTSAFRGQRQGKNHKVVAVRDVPGIHDVYCLTVPGAGNFALKAGVFVHNCGIIVNVTPFEPEWQGYVTLEISNTTPLPAKIYAGEGIAQVLFFEADEECETSYGDRAGKYQGQRGITLPRK